MRDLLEDLEAGHQLSDPDPVRRAQIQMRKALPKRFYAAVSTGRTAEGWTVLLDGKAVRSPAGALLELPSERLAEAVAREFAEQGETIDAVAMPVYRLVNTAVDGVATHEEPVVEDILRYSSSDLLCYRADGPAPLVERQADHWDPVLDWARQAIGARFFLAEGIMHVEQPREAVGAIRIHMHGRTEPFRLAAMHVVTTLTGSALLALALEAGALEADAAWAAAHVDEDWNIEQWGEDAEASALRASKRRDFDAAVAVLAALGPSAQP